MGWGFSVKKPPRAFGRRDFKLPSSTIVPRMKGINFYKGGGTPPPEPVSAIEAAVLASVNDAGYWNTADPTKMFDTSAKAANIAGNGSPIGAIEPTYGTLDLIQPTAGNRPTYNAANGAYTSAGAASMRVEGAVLNDDMMFSCILNTTTASFFCLADQGNAYAGWSSGNTSNNPDGGLGTCTYLAFDGTTLVDASVTRGALRDAIAQGARVVLQIYNIDLSSSTAVSLFRRTTTYITGDIAHPVLCDTPDVAGRAAIRAQLATLL